MTLDIRNNYFSKQYSNFSSHEQLNLAISYQTEAKSAEDTLFLDFLNANADRHRRRIESLNIKPSIDSLTSLIIKTSPNSWSVSDNKIFSVALRMVLCAHSHSPNTTNTNLDQLAKHYNIQQKNNSGVRHALFSIARNSISSIDNLWGIDKEIFASTEAALLNEDIAYKNITREQFESRHLHILERTPDYASQHFFYADNLKSMHTNGETSISRQEIINAYKKTIQFSLSLHGISVDSAELLFEQCKNGLSEICIPLVEASSPLPLAIRRFTEALQEF
ncbi:hypothetical protein [Pseudomonas sp. GM60]|uniref:hypothetical protein n=1 Tax=Pseudomonas sp. GM60 TaxID=1144334 RepID=UPI0002706627|nr:hypothetical protein [Pseudomonas sp. GM60]EJM82063.1 hypothetical protein PMI32_02960 [Pseudomonas sp. GM60]